MQTLRLDAHGGGAFPIEFLQSGNRSAFVESIQQVTGSRRTLVCTTPTVARLYGDLIDAIRGVDPERIQVRVFPFSEAEKTVPAMLAVAEAANDIGIGRRDLLIALGGGVCSDIVRYAAASIRRGIPHICVPTTLIGQIDAGIGIKGAVNFAGAKSYLGCFNPPEAVFIWTNFLATLPEPLWRDGLAEAIKLACIGDAGLVPLIGRTAARLAHGDETDDDGSLVGSLVRRSAEMTVRELALDPREEVTLERLLDFGHTFSPLIEAYSDYRLSHGQAVAIDMAFSAALADTMGLMPPEHAEKLIWLIADAGLPVTCPLLDAALVQAAIVKAEQHRAGNVNLVLPCELGRCEFVRQASQIGDGQIGLALERLAQLAAGAAEPSMSSGISYSAALRATSITTSLTG